jgi:DNA-directed RNA polymerase subunit K/omega
MGKKARKTESNPSEDEYESENNDENLIDSEEELEESVNDESSDNESIIVKDDDIMNNILHKNKKKLVLKENRISINRLTKYELVRILGQRTKQLIMGAKPLVKTNKPLLPEKMAEYELKLNQIPFKIIRYTPNGLELWDLDELYKDHLYSHLDDTYQE